MPAKRIVLAVVLASVAGCSQPPAPIVNKGREEFTRDRSYAMATPAPRRTAGGAAPVTLGPAEPENYETAAKVESIGVKDLSPSGSKTKQDSFVTSYGTSAKLASASPSPARRAGDSPFQYGESVSARNHNVDQPRPVPGAVDPHTVAQKTLDDALTATPHLTQAAAKSEAMIWPVQGKLISGFGLKKPGVINDGVNIAAASGTPVRAAAAGRVVYAGNKIKGYGNMVLVKHEGGRNTAYAHLAKINVAKDAKVKQGEVIGSVGKTGNVASPQLHFAVREGKVPLDPQRLISASLASAE